MAKTERQQQQPPPPPSPQAAATFQMNIMNIHHILIWESNEIKPYLG